MKNTEDCVQKAETNFPLEICVMENSN